MDGARTEPQGLPAHPHPQVPREELRFAVVLNGGVSLAVWMGGAVLELDRLTRGLGPYGPLLRHVASIARADVIAGTSAGGINGAALAMAQANELADLGALRDLWADQGRMESLLREPFRGSPASMLKGDEYFLPQLHNAMHHLRRPFRRTEAAQRPIDLTITTTLLHGARTVTVDALGQRLPQTVHEGRFHFRRDPPETPLAGEEYRDDFDAGTIADTASRLALAARSTAGFPIAFEPSFVPARLGGRAEADPTTDAHRPDMREVVSWGTSGPTAERPPDCSRFAVDGGVLANTPTLAALRAVDRQPASAAVRRMMLLIYPHAPADAPDVPDRQDEMPTVTATLGSLLGALSSQGSRTFVDEVERHNQAAANRRTGRLDVLNTLDGSPDTLYHLTEEIFGHYSTLRIRRAARDLTARTPSRSEWSYERIRSAAEEAQTSWPERWSSPLPHVPDQPPPLRPGGRGWGWGFAAALGVADTALDLLRRLVWVAPPSTEQETDGRQPPRCVVEDPRWQIHKARTKLRALEQEVHAIWENDPIITALPPDESYWTLRLAAYEQCMLGGDPARLQAARDQVIGKARDQAHRDRLTDVLNQLGPGRPGSVGDRVCLQVLRIADRVCEVLPQLERLADTEHERLVELQPWRRLLTARGLPDEPTNPRQRILSRLLALDVLTQTLGEEGPTGATYPVELVQLSLQTQNAFTHHTRTADDKVGGMAVSRFSGFLKRSWRMNDWTWGRLDAATMLCRIVLDPKRLRRIAVLEQRVGDANAPAEARRLVDGLVEDLFGGAVRAIRGFEETRGRAVDELVPIFQTATRVGDLPNTLPHLAELAAWALHVRIAAEELPVIARAVRAERVDGANPRSRGELFLEEYSSLLRGLEALPPEPQPPDGTPAADRLREERFQLGVEALEALDRAGIGREPLSEEGTSDQMIRTATTAAGVAVTVADGERSGLAPAKPVTRALRGAALLPYWTITGLTRGGSIARFLSLLALAFGGVLVALALFGVLPPWAAGPGAALGAGALVAAFGYGALRSGTLLHGLVLLSPLIPLVVFAVTTAGEAPSRERAVSAAEGASVVVVIAVLVLGLMLLGSLPAPLGSPLALLARTLDRQADRLRVPRFMGSRPWPAGLRRALAGAALVGRAVVALVLVAAVAVATPWLVDAAPRLISAVGDGLGLAPAVVVAVVVLVALVLAGWVARKAGRGLRLWRRDSGGAWVAQPVMHPAGSAAGWAVVYGAGYLAVAVGLVAFAAGSLDPLWLRTALATAVVFAAVLLMVAPWAVPRRAQTRLDERLVAAAEPAEYGFGDRARPLPAEATVRDALLRQLTARALVYCYLLRPHEHELRLTPRGQRVASKVQERLLVQLGVPRWLVRCDLSRVVIAPPISERALRRLPWADRPWASAYREVLLWSDGLEVGETTVLGSADLAADDDPDRLVVGRAGDDEFLLCCSGRMVCRKPDGQEGDAGTNLPTWLRGLIEDEARRRPSRTAPPRGAQSRSPAR